MCEPERSVSFVLHCGFEMSYVVRQVFETTIFYNLFRYISLRAHNNDSIILFPWLRIIDY